MMQWNPVHEAFFNFENAWSFLFLPTIMNDPRGRFRTPLWFGSMVSPYNVCLHAAQTESHDKQKSQPAAQAGSYTRPGIAAAVKSMSSTITAHSLDGHCSDGDKQTGGRRYIGLPNATS